MSATAPACESITVFAVGASVLLDGGVTARVNAITIRQGHILYEVIYWNDRERKEETVEEWEVQPDNEAARLLRIDPIL